MSQFFKIHPENPQGRLVNQAVELIRNGAVVIYPTDSCYALGCYLGDKTAQDRIRKIRGLGPEHNFTLVCRDLSEVGEYAKVDNSAYRLLKALTPGPYTFILAATREVPRRLQNPKRKTIGLRVPDNAIVRALLEKLDEPLMSCSLMLPDEVLPLTEPDEMVERLGKLVDLIIDGGNCGFEPTTVVDLVGGQAQLLRAGQGATDLFTG
jgi:tRNA threonylcarbamoyl adenosine modification protein (Sua5/YciO/YrdC/YwlC family)